MFLLHYMWLWMMTHIKCVLYKMLILIDYLCIHIYSWRAFLSIDGTMKINQENSLSPKFGQMSRKPLGPVREIPSNRDTYWPYCQNKFKSRRILFHCEESDFSYFECQEINLLECLWKVVMLCIGISITFACHRSPLYYIYILLILIGGLSWWSIRHWILTSQTKIEDF